jgi:PAS domain S-box-containing protein
VTEQPAPADALLREDPEELYEDAPCAYLSTLPDGTIVRLNRTFERWTGLRREDLLGRSRFQDLLSPGDRIYHETHYRPLLQMQDAVREIAMELVCADGRRLPVLANSVLRRDDAGDARVVRTTLFDATDRRAYERELLHARERAEQLQRHHALLSAAGQALAGHREVATCAQALTTWLVRELAEGAELQLRGDAQARTGAGRTDGADLAAALSDATRDGTTQLRRRSPQEPPHLVALPLRAHGSAIGALAVVHQAAAAGFSEADLALLETLADRAAVAIENAQLYERQRAVALTLQRAMLPESIPEDPRCSIGTHYAVAIDTLEVGGDWYDAFAVERDCLYVVVGDVVGKGLDAAATMGQLRSALRALAASGLGPSAVLEQLDRFVEQTENARGATIVLARVDLTDGTTQLACAGHPPPVLLPPGGDTALVWDGRSTPLGVRAGAAPRAEATLRLLPGTRMLLYSDGAVERRDRAIDVGIDRLMDAFGRCSEEPVATVGERMSAMLLPEQHGADDVCMLSLIYTGGPGDPAGGSAR